MTACVPKSAEQEDQTAPIFAAERKLITVSGIFGRYPTITSPFLMPLSLKKLLNALILLFKSL